MGPLTTDANVVQGRFTKRIRGDWCWGRSRGAMTSSSATGCMTTPVRCDGHDRGPARYATARL